MGKTYYVANNGNDRSSGTEESDPFRTIQRGINAARVGDTVLVRGGTYQEVLDIKKSGAANKLVTIAAYPNERPVIDGSTLNLGGAAALVTISKSQYLTLNGFELQNSGGRGVRIEHSSNVTVQECDIHDCQSGGLLGNASHYLTIVGCQIHSCARRFLSVRGRAFTVALFIRRCQDSLVEDNRCYENAGEGISIDRGSQRVTVRRNVCYDNRDAQINVVSAREVAIDANLCYHTGRQEYLNLNGQRADGIAKNDIKDYVDHGTWHTRSLSVTNNIVVGCGTGFGADHQAGSLTQCVLAHNTFLNCTKAGIEINPVFKHSETLVENNIIASTNGNHLADAPRDNGITWRNNLWSHSPGNGILNAATDIVASNPGLVNLSAPVVAGELTGEVYKLTGTSPAINKGRIGSIGVDFWGIARDTSPDIGAHEFSSTPGTPGDDVLLPPPGVRVTVGLRALYDFHEQDGNIVHDVSDSGMPLNLIIADPAAVRWNNGNLTILSSAKISSTNAALKIVQACKQSNAVTLEAWIKPASTSHPNTSQNGPARIVGISSTIHNRNLMLGQGDNRGRVTDFYDVRLRTTDTNVNGVPSLSCSPGTLTTDLTHVVYTRHASGAAVIYINGEEVRRGMVSGDLSNWNRTYKLILANESAGGDRPWLGEFHLVALYDRALAAAEVAHNYQIRPLVGPTLPTAEFRIPANQAIGTPPHTVVFNSTDSTAATGIAGYLWDFGDETTSEEANPVHIYQENGVYDVTLTITDSIGQTATITKQGLIMVAEETLPPLPKAYARFVLADVPFLQIMAYGIQFSDLRCVLLWNDDPYHMLIYETIEDVAETYVEPGGAQVLWIDTLEDEEGDQDDNEQNGLLAFARSARKEKNNGHLIRRRK